MSAPGAGGGDSSFPNAIAPRGIREIQASRRSEPGEAVRQLPSIQVLALHHLTKVLSSGRI